MKRLLSLFNLRKIEIKIYEALFYNGLLSASQIAKQINISRTSVYDLLDKLIQTGLITESIKGGTKIFNIQPPEKIQLLIEEKQKELLLAEKDFKNLQNEYFSKRKTIKPQLQIFEGQKELQQMMKDMLLYRDMMVYVLWPIKKIISLLTMEFIKKFHQERIERNIKIKVIWPQSQIPIIKSYPFLKTGDELKREVRIAPHNVDFSLGYAIYKNNIRFISSKKENFGFLVESHELTEMMKNQFEIIWNISQPYKN